MVTVDISFRLPNGFAFPTAARGTAVNSNEEHHGR
jgi:hypothetical protein